MQITLDHDRLTLQDLDVEDDWQLSWAEQSPAILHSTATQPAIAVGEGYSHVTMDRGNFQLTDTPQSTIGLPWVRRLTQASNTVQFELAPGLYPVSRPTESILVPLISATHGPILRGWGTI
ncbi:hypothetical protein [Levilactobacillus zymae]|uniref:hypothetical protein n=1 Tax=Levilactobacillus zymae TaxID=267363 RepID=UPI0028B9531D|nr:hypothetical protein [Levilactobacillus zymae]MDT6981124.1 hypothetical protein [Levilactobacillus zymae]